MTITNAQAALEAAATVYQGGRGNTDAQAVRALAQGFKQWLDDQDKVDREAVARAKDEMLEKHYPGIAPRPPASAARP